ASLATYTRLHCSIYSPIPAHFSLLTSSALHLLFSCLLFFFFNATATTEIYTLSLHDALPISDIKVVQHGRDIGMRLLMYASDVRDRKSTRLNSSHLVISYAVFCLKKKKRNKALIETAKESTQSFDLRQTSQIARA